MYRYLAPLCVPILPGRAAHEIKAYPHWLLPFIVIVLLTGTIEVISHPVRVEQTIAHIPPTANREELATIRSDLDASLPGDLSILPLKIAAACALEAAVLSLLLAGFGTGEQPRFGQLFALCIGLGGIGLCEEIAEFTYLWFLPFQHGLPVFPWGALALAPAGLPYTTGLLLTSFNLFTLWYVGVLAWTLSVLCSISKSKAVLIAIAIRAVSAGCTIALLHLLRNAYAFTI